MQEKSNPHSAVKNPGDASPARALRRGALGGALEVDRVYRNVTLTPGARA